MMQIIFFTNGNTAVFTAEDQVPHLQKPWIKLFIEFLKQQDIDPTQQKYFMPDGQEAQVFKTPDGYSWRVP